MSDPARERTPGFFFPSIFPDFCRSSGAGNEGKSGRRERSLAFSLSVENARYYHIVSFKRETSV